MKELPVPGRVLSNHEAKEFVRAWVTGGALEVTLDSDLWDDPGAWGIFLVDLARHVSLAREQSSGLSRVETLARIRAAFDAEWGHPTDHPTGRVE